MENIQNTAFDINKSIYMSVQRKSITKKVLSILDAVCEDAVDGISAMMSYSELRRRLWHGKRGPEALSKILGNMKRYGYLEIVEKDNKKAVRLTCKGRYKVWSPKIEKDWGGRWRLIGFDIAETKKKTRDSFRCALRAMGFKQMQKSLWICPYDVSEEVEKVMDMLDLEYEIDYFIADAITNKEKYVDLFDLHR